MANRFPLSSVFNCPVELALELLGGKWKPVILAHVKTGPKRYGELRRLIPKLSDKMLTQRLHELVDHDLLVHEDAIYRLAPRGEKLRPALDALYAWGVRVGEELDVRIEMPRID